MRLTPLALAASLLFVSGKALAQAQTGPTALEPSRSLQPLPRGDAAKPLPAILRAQEVRARPDLEAEAEGDVEFRRGGVVIRSDRLTYDVPDDTATARGNVRVRTDGAVFRGPELRLQVERFEGYFLHPEFDLLRVGAGGRAERVEFLDSARSRAIDAMYTSCPRDGSDPAWVLQASRVKLDFEANEGVAEGAVLRFLGAPLLVLPSMSFPISDDRRSGWLPPTINLDNRSGIELAVPYYWNIAPQRDATLTPRVITRRGVGAEVEFRYLEPSDRGTLQLDLLPNDQLARRSRQGLQWNHSGSTAGLRYEADVLRVSDDDWWKDFPKDLRYLTPRLLPMRVLAERPFNASGGDGLLYARVHRWQVLQNPDAPIVAPYNRSPQVGARWLREDGRWSASLESEVNHFTLPGNDSNPVSTLRLTGTRWHALGAVSYSWREPGWWLTPKFSFNAASYRTDQDMVDGRRQASRVIPTLSVDTGLLFERETQGFGRALRQTLEPRLLYVNTPFRAQAGLPNFDAAPKDFNLSSIYTENSFAGVDRVTDAHLITAGVTSRLLDASSGVEALRLGIVQRYQFRGQQVTAQADGSPDGPPLTRRLSDLLLLGSTGVIPSWALDGTLQYNPDLGRPLRSILTARYAPGPFRTVSATYRYARGLSEQLELGWQWPVYTADPAAKGGSCGGSVYSVGRVNYSMRDSRITDSVLGLEYDAGCWVGRIVAERLSTGRSQATTRISFQLELVGLSKLNVGSNPLQVLKDNIPGYRLLREETRIKPNGQPDATSYD